MRGVSDYETMGAGANAVSDVQTPFHNRHPADYTKCPLSNGVIGKRENHISSRRNGISNRNYFIWLLRSAEILANRKCN